MEVRNYATEQRHSLVQALLEYLVVVEQFGGERFSGVFEVTERKMQRWPGNVRNWMQ